MSDRIQTCSPAATLAAARIAGYTPSPVKYTKRRYLKYLSREAHPLFFDGDQELNPKVTNQAKDIKGQWFGDLECVDIVETRQNGTVWRFICHAPGCGRPWLSRAYGAKGRTKCPNCQ